MLAVSTGNKIMKSIAIKLTKESYLNEPLWDLADYDFLKISKRFQERVNKNISE